MVSIIDQGYMLHLGGIALQRAAKEEMLRCLLIKVCLLQAPRSKRYSSPLSLSPRQLFAYNACSQSRGEVDSHLATPVICWCFRCRELTRLKDNENKYIDLAPRWTLGSGLYIEHRGTCHRCGELRGSTATRLISIKSTPSLQEHRCRPALPFRMRA
jgi:hypothetical protein